MKSTKSWPLNKNLSKKQPMRAFDPGDVVRNIYNGRIDIVLRCAGKVHYQDYTHPPIDYWDYTILFEATEDQPTGWNQSRNLALVLQPTE